MEKGGKGRGKGKREGESTGKRKGKEKRGKWEGKRGSGKEKMGIGMGKRERKRGNRGKREGIRGKREEKTAKKTKLKTISEILKKKHRRDLEVDLFRALKRSIMVLKSKNFLRSLRGLQKHVFKSMIWGENMILK